jgi:hypothetical protein
MVQDKLNDPQKTEDTMFLNHTNKNKSLPAADRIKALSKERELYLAKRLWDSFEHDLAPLSCSTAERADLETLVVKMLNIQSPQTNLDKLSLTFMTDQELILTATHMYVACHLAPILNKSNEARDYLDYFHLYDHINKAYELGNFFIIRYHLFALGSRIDEINKMHAGTIPKDEEKTKQLTSMVKEIKATIDKIASLTKGHHAFGFYLEALGYYFLASAFLDSHSPIYYLDIGKHYLSETLIHLRLAESYADESPRGLFLMTMGAGLFADTPLQNFTFSKAFIEGLGYLSHEELNHTQAEFNRRRT